jgi:predicted enzyme related to lactoylglutathione lyase
VIFITISRDDSFRRAKRTGRPRLIAGAGRRWQGVGMPTRLVHLVLDAADPARLARFWAAALGWEAAAEKPDEAVACPPGFGYPDPAALPLVFVPVPEPKAGKNRVHLDLATRSAEHQAAEVARLCALGARPADIGQGEVPWTVLADPEGNELCVLDPRPEYQDTGPVAAVVADCPDPAAIAGFWQLASGFTVANRDAEDGLVSLRSASGTGPYLELLRVPGPKKAKDRLHLDVAPWAGQDHQAAVQALIEAGAAPADVGQGKTTWAVLTDPAGGEFCVLSPR